MVAATFILMVALLVACHKCQQDIKCTCELKKGENIEQVGQPIELSLTYECFSPYRTPVHELMHLLGFAHEHARVDRRRYMYVNANHTTSKLKNFWRRNMTFNTITPFDYGSIMLYASAAGQNKPNVLTTVPLNKYYVRTTGQRQEMTFYDVAKINWNYCNESCAKITNNKCQRGGYLNPKKCSTCICPSGFTTGSNCSALDNNIEKCVIKSAPKGSKFIFEAKSENQTFKIDNEKKTRCAYLIKAPVGEKIRISVRVKGDEDFTEAMCRADTNVCNYYYLEVRFTGDLANSGARHVQNTNRIDKLTEYPDDLLCCYERFRATSEYNEVLLSYVGELKEFEPDRFNTFTVTYAIA